jgi:hypothetical protein
MPFLRQHHAVLGARLAPASVGIKRTASELAPLGPDGLLLTPPAASADGLVNETGQALPTEGRPRKRLHPATPEFHSVSIGRPARSAPTRPGTQKARRSGPSGRWARRVSNLRPLACEASVADPQPGFRRAHEAKPRGGCAGSARPPRRPARFAARMKPNPAGDAPVRRVRQEGQPGSVARVPAHQSGVARASAGDPRRDLTYRHCRNLGDGLAAKLTAA